MKLQNKNTTSKLKIQVKPFGVPVLDIQNSVNDPCLSDVDFHLEEKWLIFSHFYGISVYYVSSVIYNKCYSKDIIKDYLKNISHENIHSYILLFNMIFFLKVGFPLNLEEASDGDVHVKQQYYLINILKLSRSSSFTSIKTVHYFQQHFIAICLKL